MRPGTDTGSTRPAGAVITLRFIAERPGLDTALNINVGLRVGIGIVLALVARETAERRGGGGKRADDASARAGPQTRTG